MEHSLAQRHRILEVQCYRLHQIQFEGLAGLNIWPGSRNSALGADLTSRISFCTDQSFASTDPRYDKTFHNSCYSQHCEAQPSSSHMRKQLPSWLAFSSSSSSSSCLVSHHHRQLWRVRRTLPGQDLPQTGDPPHPPDHQTRSVWKPKRHTITITWGLESKRPPRNLACLWAGWGDKSTGGKGLCCQISINIDAETN